MRPLPLAALLALAGCVAPPAADDPSVPTDALQLPWELLDCRYLIVDAMADAAALEARLPEGFALAADASPLAPVTGDGPYLGIEMFLCADGAGWFSTYTSVEPPAALVIPEHLLFVMWETVHEDVAARDALAARGYPVREGSVSIASAAEGIWEGEAEIDGLGTVRISGAFARPGSPFGGEFVEYMEAEDGSLAAWRTDYQAETLASGTALVEVPEGSWVADVVGGPRVQASGITGTWSFTGGNITAPVRV